VNVKNANIIDIKGNGKHKIEMKGELLFHDDDDDWIATEEFYNYRV
jgi:hypothetical protein